MKPDWIDLEGTANTRDVGGLPTVDGGRTVVALALSDAGVEREAIVADYAASADHFDELMKRLAGSAGSQESALAAAVRHRPKAITMVRFLDALAEEAGGVGPWLAAHGWTDADHATLRRKLLAQ